MTEKQTATAFTVAVRDSKDHIYVDIGYYEYCFDKKDRVEAEYLEGDYLVYLGALPRSGT